MGKKDEAVKVQISTTDDAAYATIIRSMLTAARACKKLGAQDKLHDVLAIEAWASAEFKSAVI